MTRPTSNSFLYFLHFNPRTSLKGQILLHYQNRPKNKTFRNILGNGSALGPIIIRFFVLAALSINNYKISDGATSSFVYQI